MNNLILSPKNRSSNTNLFENTQRGSDNSQKEKEKKLVSEINDVTIPNPNQSSEKKNKNKFSFGPGTDK